MSNQHGLQERDIFDYWKVWKTGICFVCDGHILLLLTQEVNPTMKQESCRYVLNFVEEKYRIELHLYVNECLTMVLDKEYLNHSYVVGLATRLLVMISQHIESLVKSWFPKMLKSQPNGSFVIHVPCWKCFANIDTISLPESALAKSGYPVIQTTKNPVYCFELEENIMTTALRKDVHCPMHGLLEIAHLMPDLVRIN